LTKMATEPFLGTWKICEVIHSNTDVESIPGSEFTLKKNGEVEWNPTSDQDLPLFACDTFEVLRERDRLAVVVVLRFGAWQGNVVEFVVERDYGGGLGKATKNMLLTLEGWATLQCQHVHQPQEAKQDIRYHLLSALDEEMFYDIEILSRDGDCFRAHEIVLRLGDDPQNSVNPAHLSGLPSQMTKALLHYLYSHSLPHFLTTQTAQSLIEFSASHPEFQHCSELCRIYLKNSALKEELSGLVADMHATLDQTIVMLGGRLRADCGKVKNQRHRHIGKDLMHSPARLGSAIRQTIKNVIMAFLKLAQFCQVFSTAKPGLSRDDQNSIIGYAKSRLPIFIIQLKEIAKTLKHATADLNAPLRQDIAAYFVTEIEDLMSIMSSIGLGLKDVLELIIQAATVTRDTHLAASKPAKNKMPRTLKQLLQAKELTTMKTFHDRCGFLFSYMVQEREGFIEQPLHEKIRDIAHQIEQLIDEIPLMLLRLDEFSHTLQEKLDIETFKFIFIVGSSTVSEWLDKLKLHKRGIKPLLEQLLGLVQQDSIERCLVQLGLWDIPANKEVQEQEKMQKPVEVSQASFQISENSHASSAASSQTNLADFMTKKSQLELTSSVCQSPKSRLSKLAQAAQTLHSKQKDTDMVFEIRQDVQIPMTYVLEKEDPASSDTVATKSKTKNTASNVANNPKLPLESLGNPGDVPLGEPSKHESPEPLVVPAHRVIVAARCPWFRRALMSGMKESIERKIILHDCSRAAFAIFLQFLYSALHQLDLSNHSIDLLTELLLLADRYEVDDLKLGCEDALCGKIDEESVLCLLGFADQFQAGRLRAVCFEFVAQHPELMSPDCLEDLGPELQAELTGLAAWIRPQDRPRQDRTLEDLTTNLKLTSSDLEEADLELNLTTDSSRLEACVVALRDVLGPLIEEDQLVQVALSADCDVNRALNHFFSIS